MVLGWVAAAALAACGTVPADGGPGGTALDGGPSGPPTTLPFVRPPTPEFTERAEHIATTLRSSGALDRYANGLVLLSERVTWPEHGPDDGELKAALGNGAYEPGPAVTDEPGTGVIRFDDGRTMEAGILGARSALGEAKRGSPGCVGPDQPCPLVITSARLGSATVSTTQGPAQLPAWEFSADGFVTPMVVVAVDPGELLGLPEPVYDEPSWGPLLGVEAIESMEGNTLKVMLLFGACEKDRAAHVYETDDVVVVGGSSVRLPGGCPAIGYVAPATIVLSKPLGERLLVNVTWGAPLLLRNG
jgi:hypothetical protein